MTKDKTETNEVKDMNVYQRWHKIMSEIEYLNKDDTIAFGSNKYKAVSEEKVLSAVRPKLIEYRLLVIPIEQEYIGKVGVVTAINVKYKVLCIDNPEDFFIICSSGEGADTQDKGAGKAMTYCKKYVYLKGLDIVTGEDPDQIHSGQIDANLKKQEEKKNKIEKGEDKEPVEYLKEKLNATTKEPDKKKQSKKLDDELIELLKKAYAGRADLAKKMLDAYKGTNEELKILLKKRLGG